VGNLISKHNHIVQASILSDTATITTAQADSLDHRPQCAVTKLWLVGPA
jgi:hypothetical protein